ncbi:MAG: endospore germination permease [Bacillota bacterium]|nr:endospore germination permease [Bacillota bacterium]
MKQESLISKYDLAITLILVMVNIRIFSLPRELVRLVGNDGWLIIIINGLISFLCIYLIYTVVKSNGYISLNDLLERNLGKVFGGIIELIFVVYAVFFTSIAMRNFIEVIKNYLLLRTPTEFILILMIFVGTYLVRSGFDVLIRYNQFVFWILYISMFLVLIFTLKGADFSNLLPIFHNKFTDYINAIPTTAYGMEGFVIAYLLIPNLRDKTGIGKVISRSTIYVTLIYIVVTVLCVAVFSTEQTKEILWPLITMIKTINVPGSFVERWEGVVMALWVLFYFSTFANLYYFAADVLKKTIKVEDTKISSLIIIPFIYFIALFPQNIAELYDIQTKLMPILYFVLFLVIPLLLLVVTKIRKGNVI